MKKRARRNAASTKQRLQRWLRRHHTPERLSEAQALPLRQDLVTLLEYVRDNKVVGTKTTGNMPLKAIREVTARFVDPPVLDATIGERTYKLRTEYDVWPLYFLHILVEVGGLVSVAPGRRWRVTPDAPQFLQLDPLFQLAYLLFVWWFNVNWLVAYPFEGIGEDLPEAFERVTLSRLHYLRVGAEVPFDAFADGLIANTALAWSVPELDHARMFLRSAIKRMVVDVLEDFGGCKSTYRENPLVKSIQDLDTFEITPLGAALLDSLLIQGGG
jgi:hypothetical protein